MIRIFGYGSLINKESLAHTIGKEAVGTPAILHGYTRCFDSDCRKRKGVNGEPVAALNIVQDENSFINGVYFDVNEDQYLSLIHREKNYDSTLILVDKFDEYICSKAIVFVDTTLTGQKFVHGDPNQLEYLTICLEGAMSYGKEFYTMFIETTWIDNKLLKDHLYDQSSILKKSKFHVN